MHIKAKFKGRDGSLGYKNGVIYDLFLTSNTITLANKPHEDKGFCIYNSITSFLNNWEIIKQG